MNYPTMQRYFSAVIEDRKAEIESTSDQQILGMTDEAWLDYLVAKATVEEITLDDSRQVTSDETETRHTLRGYDIFTDGRAGQEVVRTNVRVDVPVIPSDTLNEIVKHKLTPNTYYMIEYPPFKYDHHRGLLSIVVPPKPDEAKREIAELHKHIADYNQSIRDGNATLRQNLAGFVQGKRARVVEKHKGLDEFAKAIGIPLRKKADVNTLVPAAPKVRAVIKAAMPVAKTESRPTLKHEDFRAILTLIDNQCRQFERTPHSYNVLSEEGLRDILLGNLNALYEGAAGGETFRGVGKVDIHLQISQGEVFVAELKFWDGPETLREVMTQLRGRLTWRDSYGVALVLSRNERFTDVLGTVRQAIPTLDGFVKDTLQADGENHFVSRFSIASDAVRQATIHTLVYNLHEPAAVKRTMRRKPTNSEKQVV